MSTVIADVIWERL